MGAYSAFATVYDIMQYDVDYDKWVQALKEKIKKYKPSTRNILELACGTGTMAIALAQAGFILEGIDLSEDMLVIANQKSQENHVKLKLYQQDMITFNTKKKYDVIFSMCDGMNYIVEDGDLKKTISNVFNHLGDDGLYIFDLSTLYKLKEIIGNHTFAETFDEEAYIWENEFHEETNRLNFLLTLFKEEHGHYTRHEEYHVQRAYDVDYVKNVMEDYFDILEVVDGDTFEGYSEHSHRICFISKKKKVEAL